MLLDMRIERLIQERFNGELTSIQKKVIPLIYEGKNCLVMAPTGFGKTESALLPLLSKILENHEKQGIQLLYITPLKALNRDMLKRIEWWCDRLGITKSLRHGDTTQYERTKQSKQPPQLLITTPETLNAIMVNKYLGKALKNVRYVIVDEVHELVNSKRGVQLSMVLERLNVRSIHKIQRIGLSATIGSPEKIAEYLSPREEIMIIEDKSNKMYEINVIYPTKKDINEKINENTLKRLGLDTNSTARLLKIKELLKHKTLIFVNTRATAEILASRLRLLGIKSGVHHGSLSRKVRLKAENDFKTSKIKTLICTSSMELGIDIGDIDLVIQYLSPKQVQRLVQRIGRAGHYHKKISKGIIIASNIEDYIESLAIQQLFGQGWLETEHVQTDAYDVIGQQIIGILLEKVNQFHKNDITLGLIHSILKNSYTYNINLETLHKIVKQLQNAGLLFIKKDNDNNDKTTNNVLIPRTLAARLYYYSHLSTIPSNTTFIVRDIELNTKIGRLDEKFVMLLSIGDRFITKGMSWKVVDIVNNEVLVENSSDYSLSIPDWVGEELPVPYEIAQLAGRLRKEITGYKFKKLFGNMVNRLSKDIIPTPTDENVVIESIPDMIVIHTCAGNKINETLSKILSYEISKKFGPVKTSSEAYRIFIETSSKIPGNEITKILRRVVGNVDNKLTRIIPNTNRFVYEFNHVAKLFGVIKDNDKVGRKFIKYLKNSPVYDETIRSIKFKYYDVEHTEQLGWVLCLLIIC